jgi:hypothetical protein
MEEIFPLCEENVYPNLAAAYGGITNLQNITVGISETKSWESVRVITAAGGGSLFGIQGNGMDGGDVTFVSETIFLRPGFYARQGGHFRATIDEGMGICSEGSTVIASSPTERNFQIGGQDEGLNTSEGPPAKDSDIKNTSGNITTPPKEFELYTNFPNPFNPATTIKYALKEDTKVSLIIYNMLGQEVRNLVDESQTAGLREVVWDSKNDMGQQVASGVYIYRIVAGSYIQTRRMVLLK